MWGGVRTLSQPPFVLVELEAGGARRGVHGILLRGVERFCTSVASLPIPSSLLHHSRARAQRRPFSGLWPTERFEAVYA